MKTWKTRCGICLQPRTALMLTVLILLLAYPFEDVMRERSVLRHGFGDDYSYIYTGWVAARQGTGHALYRDVIEGGASTDWSKRPFITPPFSAMLMEPLTLLSPMKGYVLWRYALALMTALAVYFTLRFSMADKVTPGAMVIALAAVFSFHPFQYLSFLGNIDGITLFAWALGIYLFGRQRHFWSAFWFALGSVVKAAPVIAVPLLVIRRQWRWLAAYVGWVLALTGISLWNLGLQPYLDWVTSVYPVISHGTLSFYNRSLPGFILFCTPGQVWGRPGTLGWEVKLPGLVIALAFYFWCWKKSRGSQGLVLELVLAPLIYLLTSPVAWTFHFILAIIPLIYLWVKSLDPAVAASPGEVAILAGTSLLFGVGAINYLAGGLNKFVFLISVMGLWVAATVALVWLGMRMYYRCVPAAAAPETSIP